MWLKPCHVARMPRPPRLYPDFVPQHVYNRGNRRARIFHRSEDYLDFLAALRQAGSRTGVRLHAFCLMPNHWHLVLWPDNGVDISAYVQIAMNTHICKLQARHGTSGTGHVYQGRHKNVAILTERHFYTAVRYVEANALAAALVQRAEEWSWSSLSEAEACSSLIAPWPLPRPANWTELVNKVPSQACLKEMVRYARKARREKTLTFRGAGPLSITGQR
jgi:putative transposase